MLEILATVKSALTVTKQIRDIADNVATAELKLAIANLTGQLADIKIQAVELAGENADLKQQLSKLKAPPEVEYRDNVYFKLNGDGPFCPTCHDNDEKLIRIQEVEGVFRDMMKYRCNVCQSHIAGT